MTIHWEAIPNYSSRPSCFPAPSENPYSPLNQLCSFPYFDNTHGRVKVSVEIIDDCFSGLDISFAYLTTPGLWDQIEIPIDHPFKVTIEYAENCMRDDCSTSGQANNHSAVFKSETLISDPATQWPNYIQYELEIPVYNIQRYLCND